MWHYDIELVLDVDTREVQFARPHVWDQDDQATQTSNKAKQSNDKNIVSLAATCMKADLLHGKTRLD